jgi:hypothetical protein
MNAEYQFLYIASLQDSTVLSTENTCKKTKDKCMCKIQNPKIETGGKQFSHVKIVPTSSIYSPTSHPSTRTQKSKNPCCPYQYYILPLAPLHQQLLESLFKMAGCQMMELNEIHWWLPSEILQDIGVAKADELDLTIIEELASRLVGVLNSAMERHQHHHLHHVRTNSTYRHQCPPQPQAYQLDRRVHFTNGNTNVQTMKICQLLGSGRIMDATLNQPRFALAKQQLVDTALPSVKQSSRGTGVFLPRAEAYNHMTGRAKTQRSSGASLKPRYNMHQCQQKQQQQLHIHAHALVTAYEQQGRKVKEAAAAFHDHCDELGLPQEWTY